MDIEKRVEWVYNSQNNQELAERYDVWAKDYEQDLDTAFGYLSPARTVEVLAKYLSTEAKILDVGAGTGLVGELLYQRGYHNIEASDLSESMLAEARKKNVYTALYQQILGESLDIFSTNTFDAIVSVGVFTPGHAPSSAFDELVRITKPGGYIIFTMRPDYYESSDFKEKLPALERTGQWKQVEITEPFQVMPKGEPDVYLQVRVYQVN
jgi:predicted TPR repeat methyltransferase